MNKIVQSLTQRLDHVVLLGEKIGTEEELASEYSKYLCVLLSGYVEESTRVLLTAYALKRSNPEIASFASKKIQEVTNLKEEKLTGLLSMFSKTWEEEFSIRMQTGEKDALDSVVAIRHLVAHGRPTNISFVRTKGYHKLIKSIVRILDEDIINGSCVPKEEQ
jgi:hypothetical protein